MYDYLRPKYGKKSNHVTCFLVYIKTEYICADIEKNVKIRSDTSNYELERPLPTGKNKKVIGLMKEDLGGKIMTEFAALRPKMYICLTVHNNKNEKAEGTKKCLIKR